MAITVKNIIPRKFAESVQTAQYTATDCKTVIDKFTVTNNSAATQTISTNLVPNGGTAATSNRIINTRSIAAGECYLCPELIGQVIEDGGFISTIASAASALTISAAGREIT
ncbi:MAG TPA: hypothetical protein VLA24_08260 [Pseudomonadales bacterium]|nr:hypothetical protein [Pseudomonadales bacterium]